MSFDLTEALKKSAALRQSEFQKVADEVRQHQGHLAVWRFLYEWSVQSGYISEERLSYDVIFEESDVNEFNAPLQVTFNLSKPEIVAGQARPRNMADGAKCVICFENVDSDIKPGLRAYEYQLNGRTFFVQYPPYPYCDGHAVVIEKAHEAQIITANTITDLLDFCDGFPGIYIASNTDRSGTGASVLEHRHYQAVKKRFAVYQASTLASRTIRSHGADVVVDVLSYPCAALRMVTESRQAMQETCEALLNAWREGGMHKLLGMAQHDQTMSFICFKTHDTATPKFEMIMIPRNCAHMTRKELLCIKKEFVGVLEMCGFGILPGRLDKQLRALSIALFNNNPIPADLADFADFANTWYKSARARMSECTEDWPVMEAALYEAFAAIIADNSAYPSKNVAVASRWLDLATAAVAKNVPCGALASELGQSVEGKPVCSACD